MHKLIAFTAGIVAVLSGCSAPQKTQTWATVKAVRHPQPGIPDRGRAFAKELHTTLARSGVEHKIVTFTFRYSGKYDLNRLAEGTAVIYRDSGTPAHPWWLIDEDLSNPLWLPTESPERQVGFRLHRPATIVKVEEFPSGTARTEEPRRESHKRRAAITKRPAEPAPPQSEQEKKVPTPAETSPEGKPPPAIKPSPAGKSAEVRSQPDRGGNINSKKPAPLLTKEDPVPEAKPPPESSAPIDGAPRNPNLSDPIPIKPAQPNTPAAPPKP